MGPIYDQMFDYFREDPRGAILATMLASAVGGLIGHYMIKIYEKFKPKRIQKNSKLEKKIQGGNQ